MTVNLLFVAWNRRAYTEASFEALLEHTDWEQVDTLHVHDDASTDGTAAYLQAASARVPASVKFESMKLGGPVAATNRHLDLCRETNDTGGFVKIDSDFVVCPGWLEEVVGVASRNPGVDMLGIQPRYGPPVAGHSDDRRAEEARHIGGVGFMRYRAFEVCRPVPNGLYGFTEFQCRHPESRKAWITPDVPCFCLDLIDLEPWASLASDYIERGWMRPWAKYVDGGRSYYEWWA